MGLNFHSTQGEGQKGGGQSVWETKEESRVTLVFKARLGMATGTRWEGVERNHEAQPLSPLSSLEELLTTQCDRFTREEVSGERT